MSSLVEVRNLAKTFDVSAHSKCCCRANVIG